MAPDDDIAVARRRLQGASRRVALTGAGISAESGIPTFRAALGGLWSRFDPMALAGEQGFRARPERVWDWYAERRAGAQVLIVDPAAGEIDSEATQILRGAAAALPPDLLAPI